MALVLGVMVAAAFIRNVLGDPRDALRALPDDTQIVVTADLYQLRNPDSYDAILNAIADLLREE